MFELVLNFFYPPICGICGKINKNWICPKCNLILNKLVKANIIQYKNKYFDELIYLFDYNGIIREKILDYKFNDKAYIYKTLSRMIIKNKKMCGIIKKYDIIIPVPMYKNKMKKRGYNQVELIAKEIALNKNIDTKTLIKKIDTKSQSTLTKNQRMINVIGTYDVVNNKSILGKRVLLMDDVFTTGSTANECSRILKKNGANSVSVFTIAKD